MDYRTFFDELGRTYEENGLEFPYSYEGFYFGDFGCSSLKVPINPTTQCYAPLNNKKISKIYSRLLAESSKVKRQYKYQWYDPPLNKAQKSRFFRDPPDMVYTLAWELSLKIGRLPDSLHARMVLSIDEHGCLRKYIESHGV